jgi:hypothetical protein
LLRPFENAGIDVAAAALNPFETVPESVAAPLIGGLGTASGPVDIEAILNAHLPT